MLSMEELLDRGMVEEKEPLIVASRRELKKLCEEFGITNERMLGNQYSALVVFLKRGDKESMECAQRIIGECQADTGVTKL